MPERILILGGTGEARQAAEALVEQGHDVILSLAGVTQEPTLPKSKVRRGGFGGETGLIDHLRSENYSMIIDATHPFAEQMSAHAYAAAEACKMSLIRLERPAWQKPHDGEWQSVESFGKALERIPDGAKVFVTTGRKNLHLLHDHRLLSGVVRCIEALDAPLPTGWSLILEKPPYSIEHEQALMGEHRITHLICKNAGGATTLPKVRAANALGIEVLMIERPVKPQSPTYAALTALLAAVGKLQLPR